MILNADMSPMGTAKWEDAVSMVCSDRAEVVLESDIRIHATMLLPSIIRLVKMVRNLWKKRVPWTKENVRTRDNFQCQYCGETLFSRDCTIDHVIPKSQGGKNTWENTVCACFSCNNRKDNRTPSQAKMALRKKPSHPTIMEFILLKVKAEGLDSLFKLLMES